MIGVQCLKMAAMCSMVLLIGCKNEAESSRKMNRPKIVIIGDGVRRDDIASPLLVREGVLNLNQGIAMYRGARAAFEKSDACKNLRERFQLDPYDDGGSPDLAVKYAKQIQEDPSVMAVIGHGNSSTTKAAALYYHQAGIPLIMPIATSPDVTNRIDSFSNVSSRLDNCFRLPPNDLYQAKAIGAYIISHYKEKKCYLIRDASIDATVYSQFLYNEIGRILDEKIIGKNAMGGSASSLLDVQVDLEVHQPEVIVFCGYGRNVAKLSYLINIAYSRAKDQKKPILFLTDGCKIPPDNLGIANFGLEAYLTFPVVYEDKKNSGFADMAHINELLGQSPEFTYQGYGYDSMLLIAEAFKGDSDVMSRSKLKNSLKEVSKISLYHNYKFEKGESVEIEYPIFKFDLLKKEFVYKEKIHVQNK